MKILNKYFYFLNFIVFGSIFLHLSRQILQVKNDGWYVGHINLYGDLVYHLALINKFLITNSPIVDNPIYAGDKINYPPIPDYITALISKFTTIDFALFVTTFIVGIITIYVARLFILHFFKNEKIVFLTLLIFFLNGGFGFYYFLIDYLQSDKNFFEFILNMPNTYTQLKDIGYYWINNYLAYFLPQRSFHFAFPIALCSLLLLYIGQKESKRNYFLLAGVITGILPLVQAHSFLVIFILCLFYAPISIYIAESRKKAIINWVIFAGVTASIAFPAFRLISSIESPFKFIKIDIGWTWDKKENIVWFWFKNLGVFAPIYLAALFYIRKNTKLLVLHFPFFFIFILCNFVIFQPWDFDNSKLFIYWYFSSSILVSYFLYDFFFTENLFRKLTGFLLVVLIILSGTLEIIRTFTKVTNYQIFSQEDLEVANSIKLLTPKGAIFANATYHNHPIPSLTGRSTLLGFTGWVWSHGTNYWERERDLKIIFTGGKTAEDMIKKYKIHYVVSGPVEKNNLELNEPYFSNFPQIHLAPNWQIYDVSNLWSNSNRQD